MKNFSICALSCLMLVAACGDDDGVTAMDAGMGTDSGPTCTGAEVECGGDCVDTQSDEDHCGGCGMACGSGEACEMGSCVLVCGPGTIECGGTCVDTDVDPAHCGGCDMACATGEFCVEGACSASCPAPNTDCDGTCTNTDTDPAHCGACGTTCAAGELCSMGACIAACPAPNTDCDGTCTNTDTDPANCGACGTTCAAGEFCSMGSCAAECPAPNTDCSGVCTNTDTDPAHCGACGTTCAAGEFCSAGSCTPECPAPNTDCSGVCTNTDIDPAHCGACGTTCAMDEACVVGECTPLDLGFDGTTGDTWEMVGTSPVRGLQSWVPRGQTHMYAASGTTVHRWSLATQTWETIADAPNSFGSFAAPTLSGGAIWGITMPSVSRWDIAGSSWTTPRTDVMGSNTSAQNATDRAGRIWSYNGSNQLVRYDPSTDTLEYFPTGVSATTQTRVVYDPTTDSIFFGGAFSTPLYRWDIATSTLDSSLAALPETNLSDAMCSDHSGHIYAALGCGGSTVWQYDIEADSWSQIPDYPTDHGCNTSCSVHEDGWLYMTDLGGQPMYRLPLF